jgi:hypothetical protein
MTNDFVEEHTEMRVDGNYERHLLQDTLRDEGWHKS